MRGPLGKPRGALLPGQGVSVATNPYQRPEVTVCTLDRRGYRVSDRASGLRASIGATRPTLGLWRFMVGELDTCEVTGQVVAGSQGWPSASMTKVSKKFRPCLAAVDR